jgi:hypothetical protein
MTPCWFRPVLKIVSPLVGNTACDPIMLMAVGASGDIIPSLHPSAVPAKTNATANRNRFSVPPFRFQAMTATRSERQHERAALAT